MPKIQKIGSSCFTSIPQQILKLKGWDKGTELYFRISDKGDVVLEKLG